MDVSVTPFSSLSSSTYRTEFTGNVVSPVRQWSLFSSLALPFEVAAPFKTCQNYLHDNFGAVSSCGVSALCAQPLSSCTNASRDVAAVSQDGSGLLFLRVRGKSELKNK